MEKNFFKGTQAVPPRDRRSLNMYTSLRDRRSLNTSSELICVCTVDRWIVFMYVLFDYLDLLVYIQYSEYRLVLRMYRLVLRMSFT
jgi:hypothetical protein